VKERGRKAYKAKKKSDAFFIYDKFKKGLTYSSATNENQEFICLSDFGGHHFFFFLGFVLDTKKKADNRTR
jgi:hypothetical protein